MDPEPGTLRARDGLELALYRWPASEPSAVVLLVHGYAEHAGRYEDVAGRLVQAGLEVWAVDLRGHGRSPGRRADVRLFADYVEDVMRLSERVAAERPGADVVLLGHSMGGAIALRFALEHQERVHRLVLSAPFLRPSLAPPGWLLGIAGGVAAAFPLLPVQRLDLNALSRDPRVVADYKSDPLIYTGPVKARLGNELFRSGPSLIERASALEVPTLVLHGGSDRLADPAASRELVAAINGPDVTLRIYPDSYHEVFNDLDREDALADMLGWLRERLPAPPQDAP